MGATRIGTGRNASADGLRICGEKWTTAADLNDRANPRTRRRGSGNTTPGQSAKDERLKIYREALVRLVERYFAEWKSIPTVCVCVCRLYGNFKYANLTATLSVLNFFNLFARICNQRSQEPLHAKLKKDRVCREKCMPQRVKSWREFSNVDFLMTDQVCARIY